MGKRGRVTLAGVLVVVALLMIAGAAFALLAGQLAAVREEARRIRCRSNLNVLAQGLVSYLSDTSDDLFYPWPAGRPGCGTRADPRFGGAEWLATLYWTRFIVEPSAFLCPASADHNGGGSDLGDRGCPGNRPLPGDAGSYASLHGRSVGIYMASKVGKGASYATSKLCIMRDWPPNEPMACDDTQEPTNHGSRGNGGMNVLFFDFHVEWWTHERVDLERGMGRGKLAPEELRAGLRPLLTLTWLRQSV